MNQETALHFFQGLYADCADGFITLWVKQNKKTYWFEVRELERIAETAIRLANMKQDVYFGVGLRREKLPSPKRGAVEDILSIPCVWMDIDIRSDAHTEQSLPPSVDAATHLLYEFPLQPSVLVHSGHGLHGYWKFTQPWVLETAASREEGKRYLADFQGTIRKYAVQRGWRLDNTSDLARVLRVPGTLNMKGDPVEVSILDPNVS
jgi:putative DNA primase/helicase